MQTIAITQKLLLWYSKNKRLLPFRKTNDPYKIWLSEVMLQQTKVNTVIPYYKRWLKRYPTLQSASEARTDSLLKLWEGLGFYRRAKNLHKTSKILINKYKGKLPNDFKKLKELPGVGDYTANVLLALIYNRPHIAIDGNVKRIFNRLFVKDIDKNLKSFQTARNGDLAEALMEYGALICKAKDPKCTECKLKKNCNYFLSESKTKF